MQVVGYQVNKLLGLPTQVQLLQEGRQVSGRIDPLFGFHPVGRFPNHLQVQPIGFQHAFPFHWVGIQKGGKGRSNRFVITDFDDRIRFARYHVKAQTGLKGTQ